MKLRFHHLLLITALLAVSGFVHGMWSNRWSNAANNEGKDLLSSIDGEIGDFRCGEFLQINPADVPAKTVRRAASIHERRTADRRRSPRADPARGRPYARCLLSLGAGLSTPRQLSRQTITLADGKSASFWVGDFVKIAIRR
jgi:hypothetical protein